MASRAPSCRSCCRTWPTVVDDIAIVQSMVTDAFNHAPGQILMNTGSQQFGRPSIGRLDDLRPGQRSRSDLPGFVVLNSAKKGTSGGSSNWGCGFLPTVYQGVPFRSQGDPVLFLSNPPGIDAAMQRDSLDALRRLNAMRLDAVGDPEIATRINSFEMAYRMQTSAPELMDLSGESPRDAGDVRRRAGQAVVRQQLPAGAAAGRAGRAVRATVPRSLGPSRRI